MSKAVRFYECGAPEVLRLEEVEVGEPGPGEVRVRHAAVGLNFADTYFRLGYYPVSVPNGMGVEASGLIEAVGEGVTGFASGDRVTYTGSPLGAYSTSRVMPVGSLFKLPDGISHEVAAASTMRGLSAAYWLLKTNPWLKAGDTILLHAAAGGVGLIAQEQHLMLQQRLADRPEEILVLRCLSQVDTAKLGADIRGELFDAHQITKIDEPVVFPASRSRCACTASSSS